MVQPLVALGGPVDSEAVQLSVRRRLAGPEVDPTVRQEVKGVDALHHPRRVVVGAGEQHDSVAEADPRRALAGRGEEDLGGRTVAVLLEEVVFDLPHVVEAEPVGQLHLV